MRHESDPFDEPVADVAPRLQRRAFVRLAGGAVAAIAGGVFIRWDSAPDVPDGLDAGGSSPQAGGAPPSTDHAHHGAESPPDQVKGTVETKSGATLWSDPRTWGGRVPGPGDVVTVSKPLTLDVNVRVAGLTVAKGAALTFHPKRSVSLRSTGNVVVLGKLVMRPSTPSVSHRLVFERVDERRFAGGGMTVRKSDVGLWVMDRGVLDIVGSAKRSWTRASRAVLAGARTITLADAPTGWRAGDQIVITPTGSPAAKTHYAAYDSATVRSIKGKTVTLSSATRYAHPLVTVKAGKVFGAEVLNLSRNVQIEGTAKGRTHLFIHASARQTIRYATIRHVGPRQPDRGATKPVLGRYGLHFHHAGNGVRGSLVEGVVIRDAGNRAFVPHGSHGITFRDCIAHDTFESAYWWDIGDTTNATHWDRCVASLVKFDPNFRGHTLTGFLLGKGSGNRATQCVAVGVQGGDNASGFHWPGAIGEGLWTFRDCVAHNNKRNGIFVWQNTGRDHVIDRFVAYHCGAFGIDHGSYINPYRYRASTLYGNLAGAIALHAVSGGGKLLFENILCDGAGISDALIVTENHLVQTSYNTVISRCTLRGHRKQAVHLASKPGAKSPDLLHIIDTTIESNEFWLENNIRPDCVVKLQNGSSTMLLRRHDQEGELVPEWNARVTHL